MSTNIKFKAYEKNLNQIINVDSIDFERKLINMNSAWRMFNEIELMIGSGINDIHGNEIFSGHIIMRANASNKDGEPLHELFNVTFENGRFMVSNGNVKGCLHTEVVGYEVTNEIIGCIYDEKSSDDQ